MCQFPSQVAPASHLLQQRMVPCWCPVSERRTERTNAKMNKNFLKTNKRNIFRGTYWSYMTHPALSALLARMFGEQLCDLGPMSSSVFFHSLNQHRIVLRVVIKLLFNCTHSDIYEQIRLKSTSVVHCTLCFKINRRPITFGLVWCNRASYRATPTSKELFFPPLEK